MHVLAYLSSANRRFDEKGIDEIVRTSILNNKRLNVTGMLCYRDRKFIQFLEGEQSAVINLYEKIKKDNRHAGFVTLMNQPIENRMFRKWYMALRNIDDFTGIAKDIMLDLFTIDFSKQAQYHARSIEMLIKVFRQPSEPAASPSPAG